MSQRLDIYRTLGLCPGCLAKIEAADRMAAMLRAPAAAAAARSTRLTKRLARIGRRARAARTRSITAALAPLKALTLPQDGRAHGG